MGLGLLVSIPSLIGAYFFSRYIGSKVKSSEDLEIDSVTKSYEEIVASYGKLPNGCLSLAPILVPIVLMALGSIASMAGWTGFTFRFFSFLGTPIIALAAGVLFAVWQIAAAKKLDKFYEITNETLKIVGPILFITAAGGVLGRVIASTSMVSFITANAASIASVGIFFPFLLSAILKTAQGSSTVALVTSAGIVAPLLGTLGLDSPPRTALAVMAIAAGAMTVSHANDSYFWVVTNFGGMTPEQGYKTQTTATLIEGICGMAGVFILSLILH
jgi:GntP family gluconate:H+ symporter